MSYVLWISGLEHLLYSMLKVITISIVIDPIIAHVRTIFSLLPLSHQCGQRLAETEY